MAESSISTLVGDREARLREKGTVRLLEAFRQMDLEGTDEGKVFQEIRSLYPTLAEEEKEIFFAAMLHEVEVSKDGLSDLLKQLLATDHNDSEWPKRISDLRDQIQSPRLNIFRKISHQAGGLKFLLDLRGDILSTQRFSRTDLLPLDRDLVLLFELLFQGGFLYLEEITFDSSYRQIELIKNSDLVHPMANIEEMGSRLGNDRRCFALYHRLMPYEPVVFIEVALTKGIVRRISDIIDADPERPGRGDADTAMFYSINNTQQGLSGLRLGKMLIYRVVDSLKRKTEGIDTFATLSPMPGFWKGYFAPVLEGRTDFLLKPQEVSSYFPGRHVRKILEHAPSEGVADFNRALFSLLSDGSWAGDDDWKKILESPLTRIAHLYVSREKNRENKPLNSVANFHMENGATVSRSNINFLGNPSSRGLRDSCGFMVNYIYTAGWMNQIKGSFRWLEKLEIRSIFSRNR
ncbi:MAG: hypothetical protein C4576_09765 [Desulfobacteraceae bacterium]|nr:MAG: hypothetical protein C4576_09765 [Desulfobacteraceae bacterium]